MNIDDFIFPENAATPAGVASPEQPSKGLADKPNGLRAGAIPIKSRKEGNSNMFVPQSVPVAAHPQRGQNEFNYINRHHRKTSIDDRRTVSSSRTLVEFVDRQAQSALPHALPSPLLQQAWLAWAGRFVRPLAHFHTTTTPSTSRSTSKSTWIVQSSPVHFHHHHPWTLAAGTHRKPNEPPARDPHRYPAA
jgi:hypothetical protein